MYPTHETDKCQETSWSIYILYRGFLAWKLCVGGGSVGETGERGRPTVYGCRKRGCQGNGAGLMLWMASPLVSCMCSVGMSVWVQPHFPGSLSFGTRRQLVCPALQSPLHFSPPTHNFHARNPLYNIYIDHDVSWHMSVSCVGISISVLHVQCRCECVFEKVRNHIQMVEL